MEEMHHTHKEVAWGWLGALMDIAKARGARKAGKSRAAIRPTAAQGLKPRSC